MADVLRLEEVQHDPDSVVTLGTFDGVHLGHQALLHYLVERAREQAGRSRVLTFDPHPREIVRGERVSMLSSLAERAQWIYALGVREVIVVPFTAELARTGATEFVDEVLVNTVGLREVVVGYDFGFGRGRTGNGGLLAELGRQRGFGVELVDPRRVGSDVVSSSEIRRRLLQDGDVRGAAVLLGRTYEMTTVVVSGDGRGRQIGFPTANLQPVDSRKIVPRIGVYAVRADLGDGRRLDGMMNIGTRPTFGETERRLEVHLLDFDRDIYGSRLRILFVDRLRPERKFRSVDELVEQLSRDEQRCRELLSAVP